MLIQQVWPWLQLIWIALLITMWIHAFPNQICLISRFLHVISLLQFQFVKWIYFKCILTNLMGSSKMLQAFQWVNGVC
jgi:hypothetical protein